MAQLLGKQNPFISMPQVLRGGIIIYAVVFLLIAPLINQGLFPNGRSYAEVNLLLTFILVGLQIAPLFYLRLAGEPTGVFHPLYYPLLFGMVMSLFKDPSIILRPYIAFTTDFHTSYIYPSVGGAHPAEIGLAELKLNAAHVLGLIGFYVAYFAARPIPTPKRTSPARLSSFRILAVWGILFVATLVWLEARGGVIGNMTALAFGRFRELGGEGHIVMLFKLMPWLLLLLLLQDPRRIRSPVFWTLVLTSVALRFSVSGARSGALFAIVHVLIASMLMGARIRWGAILAVGFGGVLSIGVMGEFRNSALHQEQADASVFTKYSIGELVEKTQEDLERRYSYDAALTAMYRVPNQVDHLYGTSYLGATLFFVPRTIWEDKPRGVGAYVGAYIKGGLETYDGYDGGGVPIPGVVEAYWNFSWPGVFIIGAVFGALMRWFSGYFIKNHDRPVAVFWYILAITSLGGIASTTGLIPYVLTVGLMAVLMPFFRAPAVSLGARIKAYPSS